MPIPLNETELRLLKTYASRKRKLTQRQKAIVILKYGQGTSIDRIAQQVGIKEPIVRRVTAAFEASGLAGLGFHSASPRGELGRSGSSQSAIERTPGVCGQSARIVGTRIPVWLLVEARDMGVSEAQLLLDYPSLQARHLVAAWDYAETHKAEIAAEIFKNETT